MYQLVVFLHVLSVLLFMLLHGVSAVVMFVIPRQENPEHVKALMALRGMVSPAVGAFSGIILVTGIIAGFMGDWWRMGWTGASVVIFIGIAVLMTLLGRRYFDRIAASLAASAPPDLRRPPAGLLAGVGIIGVGVILWLMLFKPF